MKYLPSSALLLSLCLLLSMPVRANAEEALPAGFLALSESTMSWHEAQDYCTQQGGTLPRINGVVFFSSNDHWPGPGLAIDGFGTSYVDEDNPGIWPSGLPLDEYWTGTANRKYSNAVWVIWSNGIHEANVNIRLTATDQGVMNRAVCVPIVSP